MKLISTSMLDELTAKASASPRRRAHLNLHSSATDPVQRFIVVAQRDSYVRPHRHGSKSELATVLRGSFEVVVFDDAGSITARHVVGDGANIAFEIPRATWHTLLPLSDGAAFLEIKEGPYDPATASEFAAWAPEEGSPATQMFQRWVSEARVGSRPTVIG
jgi:cupin fold WbuC family metalloprotein